MTSDELVRTLVAELTPVRRLRGIASRVARWAALALCCVGAGALALGARPDLARKLHDPAFLSESAALVLLFVSSARMAFQLGIPGAERCRLARAVPILQLFAWALVIAIRGASVASDPLAGAVSWTGGLACVGRMIALALAPAFAMFVALRKAAAVEHAWTGFFAVLSASALAILGTQMVCTKDDPAHLLLWHVGPVVLAALAGSSAGTLFTNAGKPRST